MTEERFIAILVNFHKAIANEIYKQIVNGANSVFDMQEILANIGVQEQNLIRSYLMEISDEARIDEKWVNGTNYFDSISNYVVEAVAELEAIIDAFLPYESRAEVAQRAMDAFMRNLDHHAKTVVITETTRLRAEAVVENTAYYRYETAGDSLVCPYCMELEGLIFDSVEARIGSNMPPIHPNCRCRIVPVE